MVARGTLNPERIVDAAAAVADRHGLTGVSMRSVGAELGVEAMSLYRHVANKDALMDALADWAFAQIDLPSLGAPWRHAMIARATSAYRMLRQHPWALGMLESRSNVGHALLRHHDRVIGCLRTAGFSAADATHAFSTIDAYVYGFALTTANLPFPTEPGAESTFAAQVAPPAEEYPHLASTLGELLADNSYALENEFDAGLGLILDGLERTLSRADSSQ